MSETSLKTMKEITEKLRLHRASVYRLINRKLFPKPVKLGNSSRWVESEVQAAIASMMEARNG